MSGGINARVTGAERVQIQIQGMGDVLKAELRTKSRSLGFRILAHVKAEKLSGQVLKNKTGRLRRSVNFRETESETEIGGSVGTNVEYAAAHEYGFQGTVNVRAHLRSITQAFGRPIEPKQITVSAHPMTMNIAEKSFLRSSLNDFREKIKNEYAAVARRVAGGT